MSFVPTRRRTVTVAAVGLLVAAGFAGLTAATPAAAQPASFHRSFTPRDPALPVTAGSRYLALGDSVSFGYREATNAPTPDYSDASNFTGFPENVASGLGLNLANASCPGETTESFLHANGQSNGCENSPGSENGYRDAYPLHTDYDGTQMSYALNYLKTHKHVRLITLMIGANDGFLCQETTSDHCVSELGTVLAKIGANVNKILKRIRTHADYHGQIVILNYYSVDYTSQDDSASSRALNITVDNAAEPWDVTVADGYGAFQTGAAQAGGDTCAAGLLTTLSGGGCGVHPSVGGQATLAVTVEQAIKR